MLPLKKILHNNFRISLGISKFLPIDYRKELFNVLVFQGSISVERNDIKIIRDQRSMAL